MMLSIFSCAYCPFVYHLWRNVCSDLCPFLKIFILAVLGLSCGTQDLPWGTQDLLVVTCGLFSCGMQTLSCGMHAGSSSLTRDRTQAPCIESAESYPLDPQGSPCSFLIRLFALYVAGFSVVVFCWGFLHPYSSFPVISLIFIRAILAS